MVYIQYFGNGFNFLDARISQLGDTMTLSDKSGRQIKLPKRKMSTFIDLLEECVSLYTNTNTKRVGYGTLMYLYEDEGGVVIWYDKQYLVVSRNNLRRFFLTLKKLDKKWLYYKKSVAQGVYKDCDEFYLNI